MIWILILVCIPIFVLGRKLYKEKLRLHDETVGQIMWMSSVSCGAVEFCMAIGLLFAVINLNTIDPKIESLREENSRIEEQISLCIEQYREQETEIFEESSTGNDGELFSLFLSQSLQYIDNNEEIKELEKTKSECDILRWWLYFG